MTNCPYGNDKCPILGGPSADCAFCGMQKRVDDWVASPEGKLELAETAAKAKAAAERVLQDARVDPEQLRKPMTI